MEFKSKSNHSSIRDSDQSKSDKADIHVYDVDDIRRSSQHSTNEDEHSSHNGSIHSEPDYNTNYGTLGGKGPNTFAFNQ